MSSQLFVDHTVETAPEAARRTMSAVAGKMGYLPSAVARMSASPQLLDGFLTGSRLFESSTLEPIAREVVVMTVATRNACHVCVAMHTKALIALGADEDLIAELRDGDELSDSRFEVVRVFTLAVLETAGAVDDDRVRAFLDHGYTHRNALEVVLGIGAYTMSTFANRLIQAPLDRPLEPFAWHERTA